MSVLTTKEIMEIIPHRHPFLLIDTIEELVPGLHPVSHNLRLHECNLPRFPLHRSGTRWLLLLQEDVQSWIWWN